MTVMRRSEPTGMVERRAQATPSFYTTYGRYDLSSACKCLNIPTSTIVRTVIGSPSVSECPAKDHNNREKLTDTIIMMLSRRNSNLRPAFKNPNYTVDNYDLHDHDTNYDANLYSACSDVHDNCWGRVESNLHLSSW